MTTQPRDTTTLQRTTKRPNLKHKIHHIEPNGTVHALCGRTWNQGNGCVIAGHQEKLPCPACIAAQHLLKVTA
ncbi:hypothetical protein N7326_02395 [Corynebacterium sp. ES2794-CONJ1]|uniref:hypothetical protein n=1 Tax=unclassified Corynebacterium TaxID=2624378 RepID=UPI0021670DBB|nr:MULTISPECIES: hypothetical protein [unclassified Corynebacterium]MCS4489423.1 hypothetical protein [Corynebacterium sp. ES2775-CONJ]MCS4531335.1 hypothetical protein [Corynebacterium sp. ES2730-CONJ]MCU9518723.1 hypothetical protein [Corynebacterium sp. ES2794-CONJ1]